MRVACLPPGRHWYSSRVHLEACYPGMPVCSREAFDLEVIELLGTWNDNGNDFSKGL
jgi:hypothetical protein